MAHYAASGDEAPRDDAVPEAEEPLADYLDLLDPVSRSQQLTVDRIFIAGLERTRASVIQKEFQAVQGAHTIDEIRDALEGVHDALLDLDIFEDVDLSVEPSADGRPGKCDVVVRCQEKKRFHIKGGTYFQSNEGTLELQATLRNTLGFAEQLQFAAERGSRGSNEFSAQLSKPRLLRLAGGGALLSDFRISQLFRNFEASSFVQRTRGASLSLSTDDLRHSIAYELGWRRITDPSRRASREVQAHFGHSLKSAVVYTFRHSHWPTGVVAGGGHAWRAGVEPDTEHVDLLCATAQEHDRIRRSTTEVAGLGTGSNLLRFAKQRLQGFLTVPMRDTSAFLALSADVGLVLPLGERKQTPISDRFFLGGAGSVRGFHANSVCATGSRRGAPCQDGNSEGRRHDYLGGDLYSAVSAAINFPLPFEAASKAGVRGHVFADAGNTAPLAGLRSRGLQDGVQRFLRGFRVSAGAGLVLPIQQVGNLEVNYCTVVRAEATDRPRHGIQLGFSPQLL